MAGKKGRSGRKPTKEKTESAAQPVAGASNTVPVADSRQPDPLDTIEAQAREEFAEVPGTPGAAQPNAQRRVPENLIRLFWGSIYGFEDVIFRAWLGISDDFRGIFADENLIEAHTKPTGDVLLKYFDADTLSKWEENCPELALTKALLEAQAGIFFKIRQLKAELAPKTATSSPEKPSEQAKTPASTQKPSEKPMYRYPTKAEL